MKSPRLWIAIPVDEIPPEIWAKHPRLWVVDGREPDEDWEFCGSLRAGDVEGYGGRCGWVPLLSWQEYEAGKNPALGEFSY